MPETEQKGKRRQRGMITMRSKKKDTGKDKQELPVGDFFWPMVIWVLLKDGKKSYL